MIAARVRPRIPAYLLVGSCALALFVGVSCAERRVVSIEDSTPNGFIADDGGANVRIDASVPETPMCAVTTCSLPWATCPSSEFPCDANLLTDDDNCGACGVRCPGVNLSLFTKWSCVDGRCAFGCAVGGSRDCDNDPNTGCETFTNWDPANCGLCGRACPAGWECDNGDCVKGACLQANLPDSCDGECTNLATDDNNCGTCGNACDPAGPNLPPLHPNMHYGCLQGTCGKPKCSEPKAADCNGDKTDGCEANLATTENCGACGDACAAGKFCVSVVGQYRCVCDDGETFCGPWQCKRLSDDPLHCGGCNHACPGGSLPHLSPTCTFGVCDVTCETHYGDCDGLRENGCEVNMRVDNRNCGACGHACLPEQVCSEGKCLVAPCETGEPTAK